MAIETPGLATDERRSTGQRKMNVTDVRLERVVALAAGASEEFSEVFVERKGTTSFLVGQA